MTPNTIWTGEAAGILQTVPGLFAGSKPVTLRDQQPDLLVNLIQDAQASIDAASHFAGTPPVPGRDRLVVSIIQHADPHDWAATRQATLLWAFTRHAALAWAPRRIRVNAVGLGAAPRLPWQPPDQSAHAAGQAPANAATPSDIASTILAMWRWPSMTGQLIRVGQ